VSKLRYAGLMFVDSGVEVSGAFYRNVPQCATKRAVRLSYTSDLSVFRLLAGECQGALPYQTFLLETYQMVNFYSPYNGSKRKKNLTKS